MLCCLSTLFSAAQDGTIKVSKKKPMVVVQPSKMNVLYVGVDNPIEVAVEGMPSTKLALKVSKGTVIGENGRYIVNVPSSGMVKIFVYERSENEKLIAIDSVFFRAKMVPAPTVKIFGKRDGDFISVPELNAAAGIIASLDDFDFDIKFVISSFSVSFVTNGVLNTYATTGNTFTAEMKSAFTKVKVGTKIYFEEIKCVIPDGKERALSSVMLKVKE